MTTDTIDVRKPRRGRKSILGLGRKNSRVVHTRIPLTIYRAIEREAAKSGFTISEAVRAMIFLYFGEKKRESP